jgi:hypothetical protein
MHGLWQRTTSLWSALALIGAIGASGAAAAYVLSGYAPASEVHTLEKRVVRIETNQDWLVESLRRLMDKFEVPAPPLPAERVEQ